MRHDTVKGHLSCLILIDTDINHVAQKPTALGDAKGIGIVKHTSTGIACRSGGVFQKRHYITYSRKPKPNDATAACRIDQLIDLTGLKTRREADIVRVRLALDLSKRPLVTLDGPGRRIGVVAYQQHGLWVMHIHGRMREMMTVGEVEHRDTFIRLELTEYFANQRLAVRTEGRGGLQAHQARQRRDVGLPAAPDDRVALTHQKAIPRIHRGRWIGGPWSTVEVGHGPLLSTIHDIEEQPPVPALGMEWL